MVGLTSLFDIARSALNTTQQAMAVTGHNVANVNTPGYSRQEAVLAERAPVGGQPGMMGTGVQATSIRRNINGFVNQQITVSQQTLGRLSLSRDELFRLQSLFGDSIDQGISARLNDFFQGLQDVSTSPGDLAARSVLLARSSQLAATLNQTAADLTTTRQSLNFQITQTVTEINGYTRQIAELNGKIVSAELMGQNANDLRDQRDVALNELAKRIDVTTAETSAGGLTVFAARGQLLVDNSIQRDLSAVASEDNDGLAGVGYAMSGSRAIRIDQYISNGSLRSLLDLRDATIPDLQAQFDRLAATLSNAVNQIHRQGFGLDGSTGQNFFAPLTVTAEAGADNQGTGTIGSGAITANGLLTFHDYEIRFSSATAYSIVDATTGSTIRGNYTGTAITAPSAGSPLTITTGSNDTVSVSVNGGAAVAVTLAGGAYSSGAALAEEMQTKINAAGQSVAVAYDTTTGRFVITSNDTTASSAVNVTGGTARASLGLTSGTSTAASGTTYSSPMTVNLDGISVTVSGAPAADDVFRVNSYENAARDLSVALSAPASVAASSTRTGVPGNNDTMLQLVAMQGQRFASLNNVTLQDSYRDAAANIGVLAQTADRDLGAQEILRDQLDAFRAQVSGVSIDEELVNMIKYQRAFQAASRLIRITDEMYETLLSLKR